MIDSKYRDNITKSGLLIATFLTPLLLYLSLPPRQLHFLAWIAFIPILYGITRFKFLEAFILTYTNAVIFYFVFSFWLKSFHPWSAYFISFFMGLFYFTFPLLLIRFIYLRKKIIALIAGPSIWIIAEYIKTNGNIGLPSADISLSQVHQPYLIQIADITGQHGIGFFILFVNLSMLYLLDSVVTQKSWSRRDYQVLLALFLIVLGILFYGFYRIKTIDLTGSLKAGIVQTARPSGQKWSENYRAYLYEYEQTVMNLKLADPEFVVFPESSLNMFFNFEEDRNSLSGIETMNFISRLASKYRLPLILGGLEASTRTGKVIKYNSIFMYDPSGNLQARYRKRKLVAFGELPVFNGLTPWLQERVNRDTRTIMFDSGNESNLFTIVSKERSYSFGNLVCFEASDSRMGREYVNTGADFLIIESSDLWSNSYDGMVQNALFGVFRAVENRVPVLRSSNGGPSYYIDTLGRIQNSLPLNEPGTIIVNIQFAKDPYSFFRLWGNWFVYLCLILSIAGLLLNLNPIKKSKSKRT